MIRVAVFTNNPNRPNLYEKLSGIKEYIAESGQKVTLHIFRARNLPEMDPHQMTGEYNIFQLPKLEDYDAFIVDLHHIGEDNWIEDDTGRCVLNNLRNQKKPVVSIGDSLDGFLQISVAWEKSVHKLMDHLSQAHNCRRFWILADSVKNNETGRRMEFCRAYIESRSGTGWHESMVTNDYPFTIEALEKCFENLLEKEGGLPDAILCSDDATALKFMYVAEKHGFHAPDDYLIAGFGNINEGMCTIPALTTVEVSHKEFGIRCMQLLLELIAHGTANEQDYRVQSDLVCRSSCGCDYAPGADEREAINRNIVNGVGMVEYGYHIERLESDLLSCDTINQVGSYFAKSRLFPDCVALFLVLDRDFLSYRADDAYLNLRSSSISRGNSHFPVDGFPRSMKIVYSYEHGKEILRDRPVKALLPKFEENDVSWDYLFLPVHFRQYTVGYFAIQDAIRLLYTPHLARTVRVLDVVIENLYTKNILSKYNRILSDVSTKDAMTGFYNRLGYQRLACRMFDERKRAGKELSILFIDMDGLKKMNDNYGHECGDYALKAIASAIHRHCGSDTLKVRMGGDEFLIMFDRIPDEQVDKLVQQIEREIPNTKEVSHLPYSPEISTGYIHTDATKDMELDDYVREADAFMYEKKKMKGVARV